MKKLTFFLALLICGLSNAQNQLLNDLKYSPGGIMDTVFDHYGNKFQLKDIIINQDPNSTNKVVSFNDCNSGYFKLYYEIGSGFENPTDPTHVQRRAVLCQLFYDLSQFVLPVDPNTPVNIYVRSFINDLISPPSGVGAYASSVYLAPAITTNVGGGIIDNAIWQTINSGVDPFVTFNPPISNLNSASAEFYHGIIAFNFNIPGINWHQNMAPCPSTLLDLYSIGLHEITHALGFASLINGSGQSKLGSNYPYFSRYDTYLKTTAGTSLLTNTGSCGALYNYAFNSQLSNSVLSLDGTICTDPNLIQFAGSVNRKVYTNTNFNSGSSLSHFEDLCHPNNYPDNSYYVMADGSFIPNSNPLQFYSNRYLKEEERKVLCDIGYKVTNVFGSYTYSNTTQCGGNQIVGVNDGITFNASGNTYTYVIANNGPTLPITNFLLNDYNPNTALTLTYECPQSVFGYGNVAVVNGNTLSYTPNGTGDGLDLIRYVPILQNGQRGNITYIYIYVTTPSCGVIGACESYVNNGNFEQSLGCKNHPYGQTPVNPCWSYFSDTPDLWSLVNSECPLSQFQTASQYTFPNNASNGNNDSWNSLSSNVHFIGLNSVKNSVIDGVQNSLTSPLVPSMGYYVKFKAKVINPSNNFLDWNHPSFISIGGSTNPIISSSNYYTSFPSGMQHLGSVFVSGYNWQDYQIHIPETLINTTVNYLTLINDIYLSPNFKSYLMIDDISIVEENANYYFTPPSTVCASSLIDLSNFTNIPNGIFSGPGVNGTTFNPLIAGIGTHSISYSFTKPNGCIVTLLATITYTNSASISIIENSVLPNDGIICSGASVTLTVSGSGTPTWSPGGATTTTITVNPTVTTIYTVTVSANGCSFSATQTITVNPSPTSSIGLTESSGIGVNDGTICSGASVILTASGGGTYLWSPGGATTSSISVNPLTTTTYTVSVSANGCSSSTSRTVTVTPPPTANITGTNTICAGQSTTLTASGGGTYLWSPGGATTSSISVNPLVTTTYTVTVTVTANGCSASTSSSRTVTVTPPPTANITGTNTICAGQSTTLTASGGGTYLWSPGGATTSSVSVTPSATTTYNVTVTLNGCTASTSRTITVNPLPATFTISATETSGLTNNDGVICVGSSVTLTASGTLVPVWSNGTTAQSITISPTSTTTYTATATNANGCSRTVSRTITVNPLPTISITNPNPIICSGTSVNLSAFPTTGLNSFIWAPGGQTTSSISVAPSTSTTYTLTARSTTTGCRNTASTTITINSVSNTACCNPAGFTFNSPINTSAMGIIPNGSLIQVNADITVNQSRVFTNCTFRFAPNVKIIVNSGFGLELNSCTLFSCSEMWDGIILPYNGTLKLTNTRIEDAKTAVLSTNGNLNVNNCTFNKNYTGVALKEYTIYNGINGSTFTCESTSSPTPGSVLKAPYQNQKGFYGILIDGNDNVTIGSTSTNFYRNIINGIFANRNTTLNFFKGNFSNIKGGLPTYNGYGIRVYGAESVLIGDLTNSAMANTFNNSDNGISIDAVANIHIANNSFIGISTGSFLTNLTGKAIGIFNSNNAIGGNVNLTKNTIDNFEFGIYYEKQNSTLGFTISNNTFSNFSALTGTAVIISDIPSQNISISNNVLNNAFQTGTNGFIINNPILLSSVNNLMIKQNTIRNLKNAVWVTNFMNVKIEENHSQFNSIGTNAAGIYFSSGMTGTAGAPLTGIQIANCPGALIDKNSIERYNMFQPSNVPLIPVGSYGTHFGITVQNGCTGSSILNNQVKLLGTGIYAFGNTPITLKCNNMVNNATGLWINSLIGNQGTVSAPQDNTWTIPSGYMGVRRNGSQSPIFFTRSFSLPYMPSTNSLEMSPAVAITPQNSSISAPNTCYISAGNPPAGLVQVVNEEGEYSYLSEEELKSLDVDLYKTLKIIPDYIDESTLEGQRIREFVDSVELSNSAKIFEYEEKLSLKDTLEAKEIMAIFDAYSDVEYNYKRVYEIYNRSWLDGQGSFSLEDSLVLNEIAYLSPRVAGNAVYTARVLLGLMLIDTETYAAKSAQSNSGIKYSTIKIFPNPSSDYFHYELPLLDNDRGKVTVIDVSGKILKSWDVEFTENKGSLNINNYAKGIYFFELIINDNTKFVEKLIVK